MRMKRGLVGAALLLLLTACSSTSSSKNGSDAATSFNDTGGCSIVELASSPEKIDLMNALAKSFNATKTKADGKCVFVRPNKVSSGVAEQALDATWDEA